MLFICSTIFCADKVVSREDSLAVAQERDYAARSIQFAWLRHARAVWKVTYVGQAHEGVDLQWQLDARTGEVSQLMQVTETFEAVMAASAQRFAEASRLYAEQLQDVDAGHQETFRLQRAQIQELGA